MIQLDGITILASVEQILYDLRNDLHSQGINLLNKIKTSETSNNIMVQCPVHANGQERHPSCGISKREFINHKGIRYPAGTVHCFTCGFKADLFLFVAYCFGTNNRDFGKRYIIKKYNTIDIGQRPDIELDFDRNTQQYYKYMDESELDKYRFTSEYLYARNFTDDVILFYELGYDVWHNAITIPIRDHKGGLVFIKKRLINPGPTQGKYLNETGIPKQYILYGFYHMLQLIEAINNGTCQNKVLEENYKKYGLALTEGELDAVYLVQNGYPAVSLMGRILFEDKTKKHLLQKELLMRYGIKKLLIWMDNDEYGHEAQKKIIEQTYKYFQLYTPDYTMFPNLKDPNSYTPEQLAQQKIVEIVP